MYALDTNDDVSVDGLPKLVPPKDFVFLADQRARNVQTAWHVTDPIFGSKTSFDPDCTESVLTWDRVARSVVRGAHRSLVDWFRVGFSPKRVLRGF